MEQHICTLSLIIEGATWKVLKSYHWGQFTTKTFVLISKKVKIKKQFSIIKTFLFLKIILYTSIILFLYCIEVHLFYMCGITQGRYISTTTVAVAGSFECDFCRKVCQCKWTLRSSLTHWNTVLFCNSFRSKTSLKVAFFLKLRLFFVLFLFFFGHISKVLNNNIIEISVVRYEVTTGVWVTSFTSGK
jgi:hypothetical protein